MAIVAGVLGAIGALEAFDIINVGNSFLAPNNGGAPNSDLGNFVDGVLFLIPGIVSAFLALTFHRNEHHERTYSMRENIPTTGSDRRNVEQEDELWKGEHLGAYAATLAAIAFSVIGVLVGFHVFNDAHTFYDGLTWLLLSILSSVLAATLHSVGHHMPAFEREYGSVLDEHVPQDRTTPGGATRPNTERL